MAGALQGIKVLDCTQIIAGPLAASLLSEMGAEVVKVEPLEGEPWRLQAEIIPKESKGFLTQNRGKLGMAVDFKNPASAPIREALLGWADVLLTNYRQDAAEALGLTYEHARKVNPSIIACDVTAFGQKGPDANRRGYDIIAQAMSGLAHSNPNIVDGLPMQIAFAPSDVVTGTALAWAITAALYHRERTGEGQSVSVSLLLTSLFLQAGSREVVALDGDARQHWLDVLAAARERGASITEITAERRAMMPELAGNIYYRPYQTADGYIAIGCLGPRPRERFREALDVHDPRFEADFDRSPDNLRKVGRELVVECETKFKTRATTDWVDYLTVGGIPCGPFRFVEELWTDPQVEANGYLTEYDHSLLGPLRGPVPIVQMSVTPTAVQRASPALGEHTDSILASLGFTPERIAALHQDGVIGGG
ncbi:MAG: CoA transferase [Tepidiformaceae bacterium]